MRVLHSMAFLGPNVWSRDPVLEVWLDTGDEADSTIWPDAVERLRGRLVECGGDRIEATTPTGVLSQLVLALQQLAGETVRREWHDESRCAVEMLDECVARRSLELAIEAIVAALTSRPLPSTERIAELRDDARQVRLGRTMGPIVAAARAWGIPALRLDRDSLVQLGYGARQRRIRTTIVDGTGVIAEAVSRDKFLTKQWLRRIGVPVPSGRIAVDEADAWAAATEIGLPVVLKPLDADYGNGVSLRVTTRDELTAAYARARGFSSSVIVEEFLPGDHHRVLVVGEHVVAAIRRVPVQLVGDGRRTVADLIDEANHDPRRGPADDPTKPWYLIEIDDETLRSLARQQLQLDSVPAPGQTVLTRWSTPDWNGDALIDVTDDLHPDVAEAVIDAVRVIGVDVAGVDLIATDIRRPLGEQRGGILEVNAEPAILIHMRPVCRPPRPVPEAIVSHLFPQPEAARIPIVAVCGDERVAPVIARLRDWLEPASRLGEVHGDDVFLGGRLITFEPSRGRTERVRSLLLHPRVEAVLCQLAADEIRRDGLAFDRCDAALLLNLETGNDAVTSEARRFAPADRLAAARVLLEDVSPGGSAVINVDDPQCEQLASSSPPRTVLFSTRADHPRLSDARAHGGRVAFPRGDSIVLAEGSREFLLLPCPATTDTLATAAMGWVLGISPELLCRSLAAESAAAITPRRVSRGRRRTAGTSSPCTAGS